MFAVGKLGTGPPLDDAGTHVSGTQTEDYPQPPTPTHAPKGAFGCQDPTTKPQNPLLALFQLMVVHYGHRQTA